MRRLVIVIVFFILGIGGCNSSPPVHKAPTAEASLNSDLDHFRWNSRPIDPCVVYFFNAHPINSLSPIAAVNLEDCGNSGTSTEEKNGFFQYKNPEELGEGFFEYRHVGRTTDGKHVLLTVYNGGGSGLFEDILIVKFSLIFINDDGVIRERTQMVLLSHFTLGDRDDGKIELVNNTLFIGKSRYREKDQSILLTKTDSSN